MCVFYHTKLPLLDTAQLATRGDSRVQECLVSGSRICSHTPGDSCTLPASLPSPPVHHSFSACRIEFRCPIRTSEAWLPGHAFRPEVYHCLGQAPFLSAAIASCCAWMTVLKTASSSHRTSFTRQEHLEKGSYGHLTCFGVTRA